MICEGCADKIRRSLAALPWRGDGEAGPLAETRVWARFDLSKVEDTQIRDALEAAGCSAPLSFKYLKLSLAQKSKLRRKSQHS
jgi:hypothetical protein